MKAESQPTEQKKPSAEPVGDDHVETPTGGRGRALLRLAVIALVIWSVDQLVKWQSFEKVAGDPVDIHSHGVNGMSAIPSHDATTLVHKVLAFKLVLNEGAVFGIGQGGRWMFVAISIIALIVIAEVFRRSRPGDVLLHFGLASVLAGALGNLYDRVIYGVVRDMLYLFPDVHLPFGWTWPTGDSDLYPWIFNIADVALLVGLVALFIHMFRAERAARKQGDADDAAAPPSS